MVGELPIEYSGYPQKKQAFWRFSMSLKLLLTHIIQQYRTEAQSSTWQPVFKAVMDAENDSAKALEAIEELTIRHSINSSAPNGPPSAAAVVSGVSTLPADTPPAQLAAVEKDLTNAVKELKKRNRVS